MDHIAKIVDGKLICLKQNHNKPIMLIDFDNQVFKDMLLCQLCLQNNKQEVSEENVVCINYAYGHLDDNLKTLSEAEVDKKDRMIKDLRDFQGKMREIQQRVISQIEEILSISEEWIKNYGQQQQSTVNNFLENLRIFKEKKRLGPDYFKNIDKSYYNKINNIYQKLMNQDDLKSKHELLQNVLNNKYDQRKVEQQNQQVQLINSIQQKEWSLAMSFNFSGSILATGCEKNIKLWEFNERTMTESKILEGHSDIVYCLIWSKKYNWFASGSADNTIRCWKEYAEKDWVSTDPGNHHKNRIFCLQLNTNEDELISCSEDHTIVVWKVNCQQYQLLYDYTLEKRHTNCVTCISLNQSNTSLVSCSYDKKIILWGKIDNIWQYQHEVEMDDIGLRISFINENRIFWQQYSKGITHQFELLQNQLIKRLDLNIDLDQESTDVSLFPTIWNQKRQIVIQKHNCYVYILKLCENGQIQLLSEPINCRTVDNYGALSNDGKYLIVWNNIMSSFQVYIL